MGESFIHLKTVIENVCYGFPVSPWLFTVSTLNLTKEQVWSCFIRVELFGSEDEIETMVFAANQRKLLEHFWEVMVDL